MAAVAFRSLDGGYIYLPVNQFVAVVEMTYGDYAGRTAIHTRDAGLFYSQDEAKDIVERFVEASQR